VERIAGWRHRAWTFALAGTLCAAALAGWGAYAVGEQYRLATLDATIRRQNIEAMALTLDGKLMGSISLLGLIDPQIKQDANGDAPPNLPGVLAILESVTRAQRAEAVFVVNKQGTIASSWDSTGKPSTGIPVVFRPYFQIAMRKQDNVYAAVSLALDVRAMYFASPIFPRMSRTDEPIGVLVARTDMTLVDQLLERSGHLALLLSSQGVVFSATNPEWLSMVSGPVTPERVREIRKLRQFGTLFDKQEPRSLPFEVSRGIRTVDGRRYAVATAPVNWNDSTGPWQLVLMDDLSKDPPWKWAGLAALLGGFAASVLSFLILRIRHGNAAQREATAQLETIARAQQFRAEQKMELAQAGLNMQQAKDEKDLARIFLAECHRLVGSLQGVVYITMGRADDIHLALAGSYACTAHQPVLAMGEGLLGQCARERKFRTIDASNASDWRLYSALGGTHPQAVLLAPIILQSRLLGCVEIALPDIAHEATVKQFQAAVNLLAVSLGVIGRGQYANSDHEETRCAAT
jgi:two-component system C4-dicarboxylate transport sensor histidine kinase DctB